MQPCWIVLDQYKFPVLALISSLLIKENNTQHYWVLTKQKILSNSWWNMDSRDSPLSKTPPDVVRLVFFDQTLYKVSDSTFSSTRHLGSCFFFFVTLILPAYRTCASFFPSILNPGNSWSGIFVLCENISTNEGI